MTQLSGVTSTQTQLWNTAAQHKPVVSQDQYASTLARAGEFGGDKEKSSCISSFFGSIFGAISAFFRTLFCLDCCYGVKLNEEKKGKTEDGKADIIRYEAQSGEETHVIQVNVYPKTEDTASYAFIGDNNVTKKSGPFMTALFNQLSKDGVESIIFDAPAKNQKLDEAYKMYDFGFRADCKGTFAYQTAGRVLNRGDADKVETLKKSIGEVLNKSEKLTPSHTALLGKLVSAMMGTTAKIEKIEDIKKAWKASNVKGDFKLEANDAINVALVFGSGFESLVKTDKFNMKNTLTKAE